MKAEDTGTLKQRLVDMAEALGGKPPTQGALLVWVDVLKEFAISDIAGALIDWPKANTRMPAPADIRKLLGGRTSDRIEERAAAENARNRPVFEPRTAEDAARARRVAERLSRLLRAPVSPDDWWHRLVERWRDGEVLCYAQQRAAAMAWVKAGKPSEWAPPIEVDDREAEEERLAIQGEGA
jgi:hypothetical protein